MDEDEGNKEYYVDRYRGFYVDLSGAQPIEKLYIRTMTNSFVSGSKDHLSQNGDTGQTLVITYKQSRGYDSGRVFELEVPKNPIHYIEDGFVPQSAFKVGTSTIKACLYLAPETVSEGELRYQDCPDNDVNVKLVQNGDGY